MTTTEVIRAALLADVTLAALVGTRIYPLAIPQGEARPSIVYTVVSDVPEDSFTSTAEGVLANSRLQLDCWAKDYDVAHAMAKAAKNVLVALSSPALSVLRLSGRDARDDEAERFNASADYSVWAEG